MGHAAEAVGSGATRVCSRAAPPGEGAASPGKVQILAISSISLWQRHVCKYIFKGGFCFKNLNEQVCRVVLMRGVRTGLRSYPGPCDLQLPTTWLLGADQESAARVLRQVSTSSGGFSGLAGPVSYHPLWVCRTRPKMLILTVLYKIEYSLQKQEPFFKS